MSYTWNYKYNDIIMKYNDILMKYNDIFQLYLNKKNWLNLIKRVALCFGIGNHTGVYTYD